jgi:cystathionine gamma-synthase
MTTAALNGQAVALGLAIPPFTAHAISVSLPTWSDNVGYEMGEKRVVDVQVSGYPRFFIHLSIEKVLPKGFRTWYLPLNFCTAFSIL